MIGGMSGVEQDVVPFGLVKGDRAKLAGLNVVGLKRESLPGDQVRQLRQAVSRLFEESSSDTLSERAQSLREELPDNPLVDEVVAFILDSSRHGICRPAS